MGHPTGFGEVEQREVDLVSGPLQWTSSVDLVSGPPQCTSLVDLVRCASN